MWFCQSLSFPLCSHHHYQYCSSIGSCHHDSRHNRLPAHNKDKCTLSFNFPNHFWNSVSIFIGVSRLFKFWNGLLAAKFELSIKNLILASNWKRKLRTCRSGKFSLMYLMRFIWNTEFPWDESSTTTSTPACTRASILCLSSSRVPTAAPTSSCFLLSLEASGYSRFFLRSVWAINDTSSPFSFTMGNLACREVESYCVNW